MNTRGLNVDGEIQAVRVGDFAFFYDDKDGEETEESGEIIQIKTHGCSVYLILANEECVLLRDCWIEEGTT